MKRHSVIINADMGESYGKYKMGKDEELMKYVTSANLACGFHAGDPTVMKETVMLAKENNVSIGAHPGLEDLRGFGRRRIDISPEELYDDLVYQLGALDGFVKVAKKKMTHVCPHGLLDPMVSDEEKYGQAFIKAIKDYNPELIIVLENKSLLYKTAQEAGLKVATVAYPDLKYDGSGNMIIERGEKKAGNPEEIVKQCISIIKDQKLITEDGKYLDVQADVLGFHGDLPNIIEVLQKVKKSLLEEGISIVSF